MGFGKSNVIRYYVVLLGRVIVNLYDEKDGKRGTDVVERLEMGRAEGFGEFILNMHGEKMRHLTTIVAEGVVTEDNCTSAAH